MDAGIIKDVTAVTAHMNNVRRWHKWDTNIYKLPQDSNFRKTWIGIHGSALFHIMNTMKNIIRENGAVGMTSEWEL